MAWKKRTAGKGIAWNKAGINVLHLRGTRTEMAAQHGALLRDEIQRGALPFLGQKNAKVLEHSHLFKNRPRLRAAFERFIHIVFHKPMLAHVPRQYMDDARALAAAADIPWKYAQEGIVYADTMVLLLRYFLGRHVLGQMAGGFPGCTSIVALSDATGGNGLIHARNMDYPPVDRWDPFPTVFYCDPEGPDEAQRCIGITSAGIHTHGVTAINESGITLSAHFHCAKAVSPFGTPIQFIGSEVTRKARTLGQAVDIVRDNERAGTWGLVVSSAKENAAAVIEMVHGQISVREPVDNKLVHTNVFRTPAFQKKEVLLSAGVANDFSERYGRALDILDEYDGRIDRGTAARVLGDHYDRITGQVRAQGNTISVVTTITSMISEAPLGRFWVANSCESPTSLGDYLGFRIDEDFKGYDDREPEVFRWLDHERAKGDPVPTIRGTPKQEALRIFRKAYVAFHTEYDPLRAADLAEKAATADPGEGHFHLAHGHFRMRLGQAERALEAFRAAGRCVMSPHMRQVATLFQGHALDCLGDREGALERYRAVGNAIDPHVSREARLCARRAYRADRAEKMTFDLQFCDSFEYA